jgi:putative PIN family toxin of toxin-antitoxin system
VPRAVLDPNVLVSAFITPKGATAQLLVQLRAGAFESVVSPRLLDELSEVLKRQRFRRYATYEEVEAYLDVVRAMSVVLGDPEAQGNPLSADPDDQYLIDLARFARVDALVSGDPHLLELRSELPVKSPREFLHSLEIAGETR